MLVPGFQKSIYGFNLEEEIKVSFLFKNSKVYSISEDEFKKLLPEESEKEISDEMYSENRFQYLVIESTCNLKEYDSLLEGSAKIRPDLLIVLGILSFLTNASFIPANCFDSHMSRIEYHFSTEEKKGFLNFNGYDLSNDLNKILGFIKGFSLDRQIMSFTIFERWRKALYLEKESEDNEIFIDESVLAYMHILEILADEFKGELDKQNEIKRKMLSTEIIEYAKSVNCQEKELIKLLSKLDNTRVSLKAKVFQLLSSFNLDSLKSRAIVERFIEHRNAIAHGRKNLYQEKLVFPLPQFFSFIKDIDENVELIKILAARCISEFLQLNVWKAEWEFVLQVEVTPLILVKNFITERKYDKLTKEDFLEGKIDGVTPLDLSYYYKKKKIDFKYLEASLNELILSATENEKEYEILFDCAVALSDSNNIKLSEKCKQIISISEKNRWHQYPNIRDVIKEYEYHDRKLTWFEKWLTDRNN